MKKYLLLLFVLWANYSFSQELYQFYKNGKFGYVNAQKQVQIPALYAAGGILSEGLIAVRERDKYGYIDTKGNYVIPPSYEYAERFESGFALVFHEGKMFYINREGKKIFENNRFTAYLGSEKRFHLATIRTKMQNYSYKMGLIHCSGKILVDTVCYSINFGSNGLISLGRLDEQFAVIDTTGKYLVPFGKYQQISEFENGYAIVTYEDSLTAQMYEGVIDTTGKLLFSFGTSSEPDFERHLEAPVSCGLVRVRRQKKGLPIEMDSFVATANSSIIVDELAYPKYPNEDDSTWRERLKLIADSAMMAMAIERAKRTADSIASHQSNGNYQNTKNCQYLNLQGEIVIQDTMYAWATHFVENRAFVLYKEKDYLLINRLGKVLINKRFEEIGDFEEGLAFVSIKDKWGVIDTNGKVIIPFRYHYINYSYYSDNLIQTTAKKKADYPKHWYQRKENKYVYFDKTGKRVPPPKEPTYRQNWEDEIRNTPPSQRTLCKLNLDYIHTVSFTAESEPDMRKKRKKDYHFQADAYPEKITITETSPQQGVQLVIKPTELDTFNQIYQGINAYLYNYEVKDSFHLEAENYKLDLRMQALDKEGQWRYIERNEGPGCVVELHTLYLKPQHYWKFTIPLYEGEFSTKLRLVLTYTNDKTGTNAEGWRKEQQIYSNTFEGTINPAQFWVNREIRFGW